MKKLSFFLLLAVCVILFAVRGARNWFASSSYGQQHIILADGTKLYVVRELWKIGRAHV